MMNNFKFLLFPLLFCVACTPKFHISGDITGAEGQTIYLEQTSLTGNIVLDSAKVKSNGHFAFAAALPEYPDIYDLRIGGKKLIFAIDSVENNIQVSTTLDSLSVTGNIVGSETTLQIIELRNSLRSNDMDTHKTLAKNIIISNPRSMAAYYAIYQSQNGAYVFDVFEKADRPFYSAVATSFNAYMPDYYRTKALYTQVMNVLTAERQEKQAAAMREYIAQAENAFLDITLPDANDVPQTLSQYRGKIILLDFSLANASRSTQYIFSLRELYNKYHAQGLEIYSVSGDQVKLAWQETVANLPWTAVRGEKGMFEECFTTYNVTALPTLYLFNRKGEIVGRYDSFTELPHQIEKLL